MNVTLRKHQLGSTHSFAGIVQPKDENIVLIFLERVFPQARQQGVHRLANITAIETMTHVLKKTNTLFLRN